MKYLVRLTAGFVLIVAFVGCDNGITQPVTSEAPATAPPATKPAALAELIIDVRTKREYDTGHVAGAILIPFDTIANAIAYHYGEVAVAAEGGGDHRPGIVHRLDLETSGVMVIARSDRAQAALTEAFRERLVQKEYHALVHGEPPFDEDMIDLPLGRDAHHPTLMAVRFDIGRESQTRVEVAARFGKAAEVRCFPRTGRTHQIRVHMQSRGHPLLGDQMYALICNGIDSPSS